MGGNKINKYCLLCTLALDPDEDKSSNLLATAHINTNIPPSYLMLVPSRLNTVYSHCHLMYKYKHSISVNMWYSKLTQYENVKHFLFLRNIDFLVKWY